MATSSSEWYAQATRHNNNLNVLLAAINIHKDRYDRASARDQPAIHRVIADLTAKATAEERARDEDLARAQAAERAEYRRAQMRTATASTRRATITHAVPVVEQTPMPPEPQLEEYLDNDTSIPPGGDPTYAGVMSSTSDAQIPASTAVNSSGPNPELADVIAAQNGTGLPFIPEEEARGQAIDNLAPPASMQFTLNPTLKTGFMVVGVVGAALILRKVLA